MTDKIKEKAAKMRSMSDEELVAYVENRVAKARSEGYTQGFCLRQKDVDNLTDFVVEMQNYINKLVLIEYNDYDKLVGYIDNLYTLTRRLNRR